MSSFRSFSDIILVTQVCLWPRKITATDGGIDSIYIFRSLPTVAPPALFYVNHATVTFSTPSYHQQHLCEQNSYMTGGGFNALDLDLQSL